MWCSTCQRDCPPACGETGELLRCGQCGTTLGFGKQPAAPLPAAASRSPAAVPLPDDDWALEADVRTVHRLVENLKRTCRLDLAASIPAPHLPAAQAGPQQHMPNTAAQERTADQPPINLAAWLLLSLGLAAFACGAVLLGWSFAADREDLWPLGMPLALAGQAALIVGLVLQLDGLWRTSRKTEVTLSALDGELAKVRQATTLLTTSHSGPSQSFYLHMAEGASPQLLLADLKGQLDLLAQQMRK
jgi:hypothetical protein